MCRVWLCAVAAARDMRRGAAVAAARRVTRGGRVGLNRRRRRLVARAPQARKAREDAGVELYGSQQQLARLQLQVETLHNNCNVIAGIRAKYESDVAAYHTELGAARGAYEATKARLAMNQVHACERAMVTHACVRACVRVWGVRRGAALTDTTRRPSWTG